MTLEQAIQIAAKAHAGQVDQGGQPFILHPLRVMHRMLTTPGMRVAVLHDIVEDTPVTLADLVAAGLPTEEVFALDALTHIKNEPYRMYIGRVRMNALATAVKLADIADNSDPTRVIPNPETRVRLSTKYKWAVEFLTRSERSMT